MQKITEMIIIIFIITLVGSMSAPYIVDILGKIIMLILCKRCKKITEMIILILIIIVIGSMSAPYIVDILGN